MNIMANADYSSIDNANSILVLMKLIREQQSNASKKVVPMVNFDDYQTKTMSLPAPISSIRAVCSPSTSTSTGGIGTWLKEAKLYEKHASFLRGGLRKASTMQRSQGQLKSFPLAATKKRSLVKAHSMRTFRALWSNGTSRDQHVNREVFARKLQRGTLVVKTRK
jgi:hypothetical protein